MCFTLHSSGQGIAGLLLSAGFPECVSQAKMKRKLSITSRSSNGAWLGAEDQKALAAMPRRNASQAILVTV